MKQLLPLIVSLGVAASLWYWHSDLAALLWLAFCLLSFFAYQQWMLARLNEWAALPSRRPFPKGVFAAGVWANAFRKVGVHSQNQAADSQALVAELEYMHAAVDHLEDCLFLLDRYHHIEWSNASARRLFNLANAAGLRRPIHHYIRDEKFSDLLNNSLLQNGASLHSMTIQLPQQIERRYLLELICTHAQQRVLLVRDITEQARLDAMRSDFLANVSHELRTPLTVVSGYAESLLDLDLAPDDRRKYLETIARQAQNMKKLVSDLLELSSLEQDPVASMEQAMGVAQLFEEIELEARGLSGGRHQLMFTANPSAQIRCSPGEMASALRNLVSNAIQYTPDAGLISVRYDPTRTGAQISVNDSGLGIEAHHIARLTERFYRVDNGRSRSTGGTGLGLAIVKRIANRHGMELKIQSEIGHGSQFSLEIPQHRIVIKLS